METKSRGKFRGIFELECYRKGKLIWTEKCDNIVTDEGLDRLLDVMFHAVTQLTAWYCGLVNTDTAEAAGMTYEVPVFTESTAYDESERPEYVEGASSSQSISNSGDKAVFTIDATETMFGAALFSIDTKGDNTPGANNVLFCYAKFSASRDVVDNDIINLTYTVSAADDV